METIRRRKRLETIRRRRMIGGEKEKEEKDWKGEGEGEERLVSRRRRKKLSREGGEERN